MDEQVLQYLNSVAYRLRLASLYMTTQAGSGHITSCLSAADLVATIFFYAMRYDPFNFEYPDNDRFILSKGHAAPLLYAVYHELGLLTQDDLLQYRSLHSPLEGHPTYRFVYAQAATGSLGMGLSIGAGMALNAKMDNRSYYTYVLMGDGECAEGSVWEAAQIASHYELDNLIAMIDVNRLGQTGQTMYGHDLEKYARKFEAFGWNAIIVDGHSIADIAYASDQAKRSIKKPTILVAKTLKGYGTHAQDRENFHGKAFKHEEAVEQELERYRVHTTYSYQWKPAWSGTTPIYSRPEPRCDTLHVPTELYESGQMVSTRKAYGNALATRGMQCKSIVCLDAEVKNSTYAELFEQAFPERFIECFVAEQNMISMAVGLNRCGKIPFASTFSAFFSRCFDQIRMAAISGAALRLVGSHAGVSIGQDGPSQMGLEDIALMRTIPESIVLYPSDGVSANGCVDIMIDYSRGISYLRTTRGETPVLYKSTTVFTIGGSHVLRVHEQNSVCVVAAGITVHEALKAHDILQARGIFIAVVDLYSIKPIDVQTLQQVAASCKQRIITVEDHYQEGGIGQAVCAALRNTGITIESLAVSELPRSGKPDELLAWAKIDAQVIVEKVMEIICA